MIKRKIIVDNQRGFTLIELLIVVALLGLLAAIAIPTLIAFIGKGQVESANAEADIVRVAILAYAAENELNTLVDIDGTLGVDNPLTNNLSDYILTSVDDLQAIYHIEDGIITNSTVAKPNSKWGGLVWNNGQWK